MTKLRPLAGRIQAIGEIEGGPETLWYMIKGQVDPQVFVKEIAAYFGEHFTADQVEHTHVRNVPCGADLPGLMSLHRASPGRGAYEVTLLDAERHRPPRWTKWTRGPHGRQA